MHLEGTFWLTSRCSAGCARMAAGHRQRVLDLGPDRQFRSEQLRRGQGRYLGAVQRVAIEGRKYNIGSGRWRRAR